MLVKMLWYVCFWNLEYIYMRFHFGRNEIFSYQCLFNFLLQTEMKLMRVLFHCSHFDKNESSFRVIKFVNTTGNKIIRKETSAHVCISSKPELLTERAVFLGPLLNRNFISLCPQWKVIKAGFLLWWNEILFRVSCTSSLNLLRLMTEDFSFMNSLITSRISQVSLSCFCHVVVTN